MNDSNTFLRIGISLFSVILYEVRAWELLKIDEVRSFVKFSFAEKEPLIVPELHLKFFVRNLALLFTENNLTL